MNKLVNRGTEQPAALKLKGFLGLLILLALTFSSVCTAKAAELQDLRILVLPFQVTTGPQFQYLDADLPGLLSGSLTAKGLRVVSEQDMIKLLTSRKIATLDVKNVRELGKTIGATHAVYGSVSQVGDALSIDVRLVEVGGAQTTKPLFVEVPASKASVSQAVEELASRINGEIERKGSVAGVEVKGTKVLDADVVLMRINTRKGDPLDSAAIDREIKRIWDLGYFSDVTVDVEERPDGLFLVYTVTEKPRIETITVEGAEEIDSDDILSAISTKSGSVLNEKVLSQDLMKILELYRQKGYYLATVDQRVDMRKDGATAALVLTVNEGKRLYISSVKIEGAEQISESDVKDQLLLSERGMISWITGTGVLKEELIERDSAAISQYYLDHGFIDITVGAAKIDYTEDGIDIVFPIKEGAQYTLNEVIFDGDVIDTNDRLFELIEMDDLAADKSNFKLSVMQEDARKLTEFYADYGYAFADISPSPRKVPDMPNTVNVVYHINKKNKVYVRRVTVEGNNKTRDNVILREMRLTDGDVFDGTKLRRSTDRLNKLGYFEVAEAELVPTENDEEVDLKIKVKEKPTGALMGGFGYSTFSSFGVSGTVMERNLWGKGYTLAFQAGFSGRRNSYTVTFNNPRVNDTNLAFGVDLYHWRDDYIDYQKRTTGGVMRFGYPIGEYTTLGWGYRLDRYRIYDLDDDVSELISRYDTGDRYTSAVMMRIMRDTTNREHPTDGNIDWISLEYGGGIVGGDDDFITVTAEHQTYYQLVPDHVLHARIKGSAIFKNGSSEIPVFERFWMGGIETVRGYRSRDIVPRDPKTGDRIGGTRMAFANLEYIWSLSNELGLNIVPFFDIGFNYADDQDYNFNDEILKSVGLELRWRSPMGDLRFSYGIPLDEDRQGNKKSGRFEFSMGQFF